MLRLTTLNTKKTLLLGVFMAALTTLIGFQSTGVAAQRAQLWSIVAHYQYEDGSEFDYTIESGVPTKELGAALAECGRSHRFGASVVNYHCYPVPE